ncbi:SDR family NAD(P)-dependent oxidoreductase [Paraburkholderia caballeronis]|uniref:SDR family NAD(P)-dependent oxidoreductase n=1 Tax=Paraburkholderia caballeronis TaxID=416943 RepID=UPI001066C659|nr:SDR family NAD(P)-dependent oxidoreductase [Paraburkholderia caballeronis]TDV15670.1 NADP-dependent 3-hydroxy acid dehydrogenase YdfG [Paraburkholderia caballeronis]TDV17925.1 NADP-dependent 3-hydroxy acid dehydrogenase YdfG [Paraburkholderia caballeronis]TDV26461.1 NADP-dependent 3-hydroxy acid dehydrogenase YdfG [Paraburkholderia caballeronis]
MNPQDTVAAGGRVVMLSGASRGIGAAIAQRLYDDGYRLSIGVRDPAALQAPFAHDAGRVLLNRYEAHDAASPAQWVAATLARFGRIDALVNNAGALLEITLERGDESALDAMWEINVKAPYRTIRAALPALKQAGNGRVINVASTDGKRYRPTDSVGYAMTKHALMALTHAVRFDGWAHGVRATALCPGAVDTGLIANLAGVTPVAERLQPSTVADTVAFLLTLPNNATVAELVLNTRLESSL